MLNKMSEDIEKILKSIYYNADTGYQSAQKLYQRLKELEHKNITLKTVTEWLNNQKPAQLTKQIKKPKRFSSIIATGIRNNYQLDIIVYDRYEFNKYKYILCVIDVYSRYAQCVAMTSRKMKTIIEAVKTVFKNMGWPENLNCDNEFNVGEFNKLMEEHDVKCWFSEPNEINKNAIIERFNRTLAFMIQKWRIATGKYDWAKVLPNIVKNYNNQFHSTIKTTPLKVWEGKEKNKQVIVYLLNTFKVNDQVRIKRNKKIFDKGDVITYSKELYIVISVNGYRVKIKNIESGEELKQNFKPYQLILASNIQYLPEKDETEYQIHKETRKEKKHAQLNKDAGIDLKNIVKNKRIDKKEKEPE